MDEEYRKKAGKKASMVAVGSNCLLTALNLTVGLAGGSYALFAEGLHTLSDVVTSVIAYVGFRIGQLPPDERFPEGYGRAEAIAGLVIVIFLSFISIDLIEHAFIRFTHPEMITTPDSYVLIMAAVGIIINFIISRYVISMGRKINSPAIEADGQHQRTDIYTSVAILVGVGVAKMGFPILDPIIGLVIGVLILKTAFMIGKENILSIMGNVPRDGKIVERIEEIANSTPRAFNAHNIRIDNFASYLTVTLHVMVDGELTVAEAYEITNQLEERILELPEIKFVTVKPCPFDENHSPNLQ